MPWPWPRWVAASPNGITSTGSGKRPRTSTHLVSSAITIMRSEAAATIFSRNSAPPPPLIRLSAGSISSAPSTVRSSRSISSSVVSGILHASAWARVASEVGTPITFIPARNLLAEQVDKMLGGRAGAEPELHAVAAPAPARAPPPAASVRPYPRADDASRNPPIRGRMSSVVLGRRNSAIRPCATQDYGADTLSIAAKMAANRSSTSARMPGWVKM